MTKNNILFQLHPLTALLYFAFILGCVMFAAHPAVQLMALFSILLLLFSVRGVKKALGILKLSVPAALVCAVVNTLFSHRGITTLFYFPTGNPCTLESLLYGVSLSVMLLSMFCGFAIVGDVFTSDKILCLFGRVSPALSLVLSMALRFLPYCRRELSAISDAQMGAGTAHRGSSKRDRAKYGMSLFSALFSVSIENALDTADSMRARGYGSAERRTSYTVFRFSTLDQRFLVGLFTCAVSMLWSMFSGALAWEYYPYPHGAETTISSILTVIFFSTAALSPLMLTKIYEKK